MKTMRTIPVKTQVVDTSTGKVTEERMSSFMIMPPAAGLCQVCAVKHETEQPHNQQSLHYQYAFYGATGRWPTWADAIAHCSPEIQTHWRKDILAAGAWSEPPDGIAPIEHLPEKAT